MLSINSVDITSNNDIGCILFVVKCILIVSKGSFKLLNGKSYAWPCVFRLIHTVYHNLSVSEAYVGPYQASVMELSRKSAAPIDFCQKVPSWMTFFLITSRKKKGALSDFVKRPMNVVGPRTLSILNPFHATGLFRYPLKTSENLWFSDVFRGY